jgi:26S proteasome regulatory subunit N8
MSNNATATKESSTDAAALMIDSTSIPLEKVIIHPLVLLSVVDHFNRMKHIGNTKRVVGVLLGSLRNKILDVSNSFAGNKKKIENFYFFLNNLPVVYIFFKYLVPFDEEDRDKDVWFFDHEYLENMYGMFKKVNGK